MAEECVLTSTKRLQQQLWQREAEELQMLREVQAGGGAPQRRHCCGWRQ